MLTPMHMLCALAPLISVVFGDPVLEARATPTCTLTPTKPTPKGTVCGIQGRSNSPAIIYKAPLANLNACVTQCFNNKNCQSFAYGPQTTCTTFSKPVASLNFKQGSTGQTFYARTCYHQTCGVCPAGQTDCSNQCVYVLTDSSNCGKCGNTCENATTCTNGQCKCADGSQPNFQSDPENCGTCGNQCGPGQTCSSGVCSCPPGQLACGSACVDPQTDPNNCGSCGNAAASGQTCCNGQLSDTSTDSNNCGGCGNTCNNGCVSGICSNCNEVYNCGSEPDSDCSDGDCLCNDIDGSPSYGICSDFYSCGTGSCGTSADCPSGYFCSTRGCCGSQCYPIQSGACPNGSSAKRLFRRDRKNVRMSGTAKRSS